MNEPFWCIFVLGFAKSTIDNSISIQIAPVKKLGGLCWYSFFTFTLFFQIIHNVSKQVIEVWRVQCYGSNLWLHGCSFQVEIDLADFSQLCDSLVFSPKRWILACKRSMQSVWLCEGTWQELWTIAEIGP